jgi:hypothetical protein
MNQFQQRWLKVKINSLWRLRFLIELLKNHLYKKYIS